MRKLYYENPKQHYKELAIKEAIKINLALIRRGLKVYKIDSDLNEFLVADMSKKINEVSDTTELFVILWKKAYLFFINKKLSKK